MPQVIVENLAKTYRIAKRRTGFLGALGGIARREYHLVRALTGVSFELEPGELVGYIGPNGAGKSTTIKILSGILVPDSGRCQILGKVPWRERAAYVGQIGVVFGQRSQLWWDLPVVDSFDLLRDIYRVPPARYGQSKDTLVQALGLAPLLDVPVRQLSLGQRMRCELAASLLHAPRLLFLDEPTIGLDAVSKLAVRDFIRELNRQRELTVILTTHDMDDIEALCHRVMVIGRGSILFDGTLDRLRASVSPERRLIIEVPPELPLPELALPAARVVKREGEQVHISFDPRVVRPAQLIGELSASLPLRDLYVVNPPIEEIIAKLYGVFDL
ncbi:MAG: ATP-binding cassette domain-containing protein [bacterium]|nr:ATP-binding cassette domain-containing protein [bacterium]